MGPRTGLDVVLGIFGPQLLGNKGKFPGARACLMGAAVRGHGSIFCSMMYLDVFASGSYTVDECDCL